MLQLVGHYLVSYANPDGSVDERVLDDALTSAQRDFEDNVCRTTIAALSDKDVSFLVAMAQDKHESAISQIASRMDVTPEYAQQYRRRLRDSGIITVPRRAHVSFAVPYLAEYLKREYL